MTGASAAAAQPGDSTGGTGTRAGTGDLAGRRALVTGAASGIGLACAKALAAAGAEVTALDVDHAGATRAAEAVGGTPWSLDLLDTDAVVAAGETLATFDILVNNAGVQHVSPIESFPPERFRQILMLMLEAPFLLIRGALPGMYKRGFGRIVNVSSVHGIVASPFKSAYVAAKHGLEGLSKVAALEGGPHGVTSNCVNPSYVRTPLVDNQIADQARIHGIAEDEVVTTVMLAENAVKRLVEPAEVAELVLWLCGPHSGMVTGSSFAMDGGWSAR